MEAEAVEAVAAAAEVTAAADLEAFPVAPFRILSQKSDLCK